MYKKKDKRRTDRLNTEKKIRGRTKDEQMG